MTRAEYEEGCDVAEWSRRHDSPPCIAHYLLEIDAKGLLASVVRYQEIMSLIACIDTCVDVVSTCGKEDITFPSNSR